MKKLLVWDCDNTLWLGTLLDGDRVHMPQARISLVEELTNRGVLQAIATRNLHRDVEEQLHKYGVTQHFLVVKADLETPKSKMITEIIAELGLARMSDVTFVDDEMFNREEVAANCSGIQVVHPGEIADIIEEEFSKPSYTVEDRMRVDAYRAELQRKRGVAVEYKGDYQAFLNSCGLKLEISSAKEEDMPRVIDLVKRSNQLSALACMFSEEQLRDARGSILVGRVSDKYGDYGLSTVLWVDENEIKLIVISCRLQGKGIGSALLGWLINKARSDLMARVVTTEYNSAMIGLYMWYGFDSDAAGENTLLFTRDYADGSVKGPDWVEVIWK